MPVVTGPAKGASSDLKISQDDAGRFFVGLSWDPREAPNVEVRLDAPVQEGDTLGKIIDIMMKPLNFLRVGFWTLLKGILGDMYADSLTKKTDAKGRDKTARQFDLDLDCYIFCKDMNYLRTVGTEDDNLIDPSRRVYHTGDNQGGLGGGDDEQVFVETKGLPAEYHHLFFVVKSDSKFTLGEFLNPKVRLTDSKTEQNALESTIVPEKGVAGLYNYVFCRVSRSGEGWKFFNIDEYLGDDIPWEARLPDFAKVA